MSETDMIRVGCLRGWGNPTRVQKTKQNGITVAADNISCVPCKQVVLFNRFISLFTLKKEKICIYKENLRINKVSKKIGLILIF